MALEGYKLELLNQNPNASFCVIDQDEILPEKFTTKYKSVIVQGKITVADEHEKRNAITHLAKSMPRILIQKTKSIDFGISF